jgi:hypothetical protein
MADRFEVCQAHGGELSSLTNISPLNLNQRN